jgi:signal transduction histidine kinase/CheY-like chemotaxis protein
MLSTCTDGFAFSPAIYIGLLTVFGLLVLLFWLVTRERFPGRRFFAATVGAMSVWLALAVVEIGVPSFACKTALASATWPAICVTPIAWCLFMWNFCFEPSEGQNRTVMALGALILVVITAGVLTNPLHGLFYGPETRLITEAGSSYAYFDHGPLFFVAVTTLYVFFLLALWIAILACVRAAQFARPLMMSLLLATIAPMSANILYITLGTTLFGFDPTPFAFAFVLIALTPLVVSPRGFDAAAAARDLLFFNTPDPVFIVNRQGEVINANPSAHRLWNDDALRRSAQQIDWLQSLGHAAQGDTTSRDLSLGNRDFRLKTIPISRPLDEAGDSAGSIAILSDFTELNREKERFEIIAETVSDVVWDYDIEAGRSWGTPLWPDKLGVELEDFDIAPDQWLKFVSDKDRPRVIASLVAALRSDRDVWREETVVTGKDGKVINVQVNAKLLRRSNGRVYRALGSLKNIDQEKQLSDLVAHTRGLQAVSQMTGGIAHDFNNLLMIILGNTELLEMARLEEEDRESVELISKAATSASQLTKRLLQFAGKSKLKTTSIDPGEFLESLLPLIRSSITNEITVSSCVAPDAWPIKADPVALEQCLLNLALNARDAMPRGGTLDIRVENAIVSADMRGAASGLEPGRYVSICVSDDGEGMTKEVLNKAREPFFTTKEIGKGTGLGLSTAFGFAKQTGGAIEIRSDKDSGTRVQVYLPAADAAQHSAQDSEARGGSDNPLGSHAGMGRSILLVEDQKEIRDHLFRLLSRSGYKVTSAEDGPTALGYLGTSGPFDLLFTDVTMPGGMNGFDLVREAAEIAPRMKVVLSSGFYADALEKTRAGEVVNSHILNKPYTMEELFKALDIVFDED